MRLFELQIQRPESDKNFPRSIMPQIRKGDIDDSPFNYNKENIDIKKLMPVQKQRVKGMHDKAKRGFADGTIRPIVIDKDNYIVNGHHRFDIALSMGTKKVDVLRVDSTIEELIDHFSGTSSDVATFEAYIKEKLAKAMEEELDEGWKDVARAVAATAVIGMGVAGLDSAKPNDFATNTPDYTLSSAELTDMIDSPQYKNLYIKYANKFDQDAENSTDRNLIKRAAHVYAQKEFLNTYPTPGDHIGKASELGQNPSIIPGADDFQKDMDAEELAKAKAKAKAQQDYEIDQHMPSSMPDRVGENFADGKKKGKSRPGRVKKSGASCDGSVTSLRKKAKNSSGEKSKMYHWCANMKSGKKKS